MSKRGNGQAGAEPQSTRAEESMREIAKARRELVQAELELSDLLHQVKEQRKVVELLRANLDRLIDASTQDLPLFDGDTTHV